MPLAKLVMAASIAAALPGQSGAPPDCVAQQLWNSSRNRTTKRELAGVFRSIFGCAATYASAGFGPAKYGCCGVPASGLWQLTQNLRRIGVQISAWNCDESVGNCLPEPTVCDGGACKVMPVEEAEPAPTHALIQVSIVSAHALGSDTQQLWPLPTFRTSSD